MNEQLSGQVIPIKELKAPPVLYKYRAFDNNYHKRGLFNNELYLPSAREFNDPYDSKIPFRYKEEDLTPENIFRKCYEIAKQIIENGNDSEYQHMAYEIERQGLIYDSHHLDEIDKSTFERLCNDYGIFCLTPDAENMLMWSYYANSHRGFCIGYNTQYLIESKIFGMGGRILYRDDFPKLPLFMKDDDNPLLNILYTKWNKWQHENEYRLIHTYKNGKVLNLPKEAYSEIVLGCQIKDEEKLRLTSEIIKHLPEVKISQIQLMKDGFGLQKFSISDDTMLLNI